MVISGRRFFAGHGKGVWIAAGVLSVTLLAIAAAFGYAMTGPADRRPGRAEQFMATVMRRILVPLHARNVPAPPKVSAASLLEGRRIYLQACSMCHAATGHGDRQLADSFWPPVPDITGHAAQRWTDRELFWIIRNGIRLTGMPAWRSTLNEEQTWQVVAYVRRLAQSSRASQVRAVNAGDSAINLRELALQTIDEEGCRDCHRILGSGALIGPNLSEEWARGRSDEWLTGHFRNPKAYTPGTLMPSFSHLSDQRLKALVLFLQEPG